MIEKASFVIYLFDGKTKEKENLSANIEQIGVFVQGRTEERRKSGPSGKDTHGKKQMNALSEKFKYRERLVPSGWRIW